MVNNKKSLKSIFGSFILIIGLCSISLCGCGEMPGDDIIVENVNTEDVNEENVNVEDTKNVRIISTSDLHGRMLAYDYALNEADASGSLAKAASVINEYRDENTILVDVGDTIQDNFADIFNAEPIHPMVMGMNAIGYDICTVGNHEFNYGMDVTKKYINTMECKCLLGNVYDLNGELLTEGYAIVEKNGIRIAFIGMVTPNISNWDKANLMGYAVTDPAIETNKIIDSIESEVSQGKLQPVDAYVGVFHMMEEDEYGTSHSGFASMARECPRLNLILGSHGHEIVNGTLANNICITENLSAGKSVQIADITFDYDSDNKRYSIKDIVTTCVETKEYTDDQSIVDLLSPYDSMAKEHAKTKIGVLEGGPLVQEGETKQISALLTEDTPLQTFIQNVMKYYANADIAISAPCSNEDNALPGDMTVADVCNIYKYANTLYSVKMSGAQLKKYLEWSASFYQQYEEGDLTVAFEDTPVYMLDTASDVNYDIDVSKPVGERIVNLTYPDGRKLDEDDELVVAINDYRYNTAVSIPGVIYDENDMPELLEADIRSDIGDIRFLLIDYVQNIMNGTITNECDNNWKLIGNNWDEDLHNRAVLLVNDGTIQLTQGAKYNPCVKKIRVEDLP